MWGVLVQGRGLQCAACYTLKTDTVKSTIGYCTYLCLARASSFGEDSALQFGNSWLVDTTLSRSQWEQHRWPWPWTFEVLFFFGLPSLGEGTHHWSYHAWPRQVHRCDLWISVHMSYKLMMGAATIIRSLFSLNTIQAQKCLSCSSLIYFVHSYIEFHFVQSRLAWYSYTHHLCMSVFDLWYWLELGDTSSR